MLYTDSLHLLGTFSWNDIYTLDMNKNIFEKKSLEIIVMTISASQIESYGYIMWSEMFVCVHVCNISHTSVFRELSRYRSFQILMHILSYMMLS